MPGEDIFDVDLEASHMDGAIDGVLSLVTILYGKPFVGKSRFLSKMIHDLVGDETHFLGHRITGGPHRVLVIANDPGEKKEYARRLRSDLDVPKGSAVYVMDGSGLGVDQDAWRKLAANARDGGCTLVIVDNLLGMDRGVDVNENSDIGQCLACLDMITDQGIPVVLVHHSSKSGGGTPMGSTSLTAWARNTLFLENDKLTVESNSAPKVSYKLVRDSNHYPIEMASQVPDSPDSQPGDRGKRRRRKAETKATEKHRDRCRAAAELENLKPGDRSSIAKAAKAVAERTGMKENTLKAWFGHPVPGLWGHEEHGNRKRVVPAYTAGQTEKGG